MLEPYAYAQPVDTNAQGLRSPQFAHQGGESTTATTDMTAWNLNLLQALEWKRFIEVCEKFFRSKGISCTAQSSSLGYGFDLHLYQADTNQPTTGVLCKPWVYPPRDLQNSPDKSN